MESQNIDETEVTDVIAFFKELKIPADISAFKADVPKLCRESNLVEWDSRSAIPQSISLSLSLFSISFFPSVVQMCKGERKEKQPLLSLETPLAIMERRAFQ